MRLAHFSRRRKAVAAAVNCIALAAALPQAAHAQAANCNSTGTAAPNDGTQTVCGNSAIAYGQYSTAVGYQAGTGSSGGNANSAFGATAGSKVSGSFNNATGYAAGDSVSGNNNNASGYQAGQYVGGSSNIAMGTNAGQGTISTPLIGNNTVSIGTTALASKDNAIALGNGATAGYTDSAAIGTGVTATRADQISIGNATSNYTLAGLNGSTAYQTGPVALVTADGSGTLGTTSSFSLTSLTVTGDMKLNTVTMSKGAKLNGGASVAGGLTATGGTTTDMLTVTNGATIANGLTVANGGANITGNSEINGNFAVTGDTVLNTLTVNGAANLATVNATTVSANTANVGTVNANTVNASTVNTITANAVTVNTANANVSNSLSVAPGATIDMGGNRVQDVGTPILPADAANKAYVDAGLAAANQRIDKVNQGVAIAMSVQNPVLTGSDRFGVAVNWGDFAGYNAIGGTVVGIIGQNVFGGGEKIGLTGGFGASSNQVAGRVGVQLTW